MGNIGRSSTGCGLCRKRKIKVSSASVKSPLLLTRGQCDEAKPGCKKCAQIRKPCPGYPFQVQLQLRPNPELLPEGANVKDQLLGPSLPPTHSIIIDVRTTLPNSDGTKANKVKTETATSTAALQKLAPAHRSISPPLRYDIQHQSLCFFLNLFCFQAGKLYSFPVLDFLPDMLQKADPHSCVAKAAMAVSRMTLADRYSGKDVRLQTGREYGHALKLTNATIRDSSASVQDETVIAVWLLGLYEVS